jgi:hypothetical protein
MAAVEQAFVGPVCSFHTENASFDAVEPLIEVFGQLIQRVAGAGEPSLHVFLEIGDSLIKGGDPFINSVDRSV